MRFRQEFYEELQAGASTKIDEELLWKLTRLKVVRTIVLSRKEQAQGNDPRPLFDDTSYQNHLLPAWNALLASRRVCPMLPRVHYRLALMSPLVDASTEDVTRHLDRSIFLGPKNIALHFNSGTLMVDHGKLETGLEWISKATIAQHYMPPDVAAYMKSYLSPAELVNSVLPDDPAFILDVVNRYFRDEDDTRWRLALANRSLELLTTIREEDLSANDLFLIARSLQFAGQPSRACDTYRKAIEIEPGMAKWRFGYAETLSDTGDFDAALREAQLCERMMPDSWRVKRLIYDIQKSKRKRG